jgi:DNA-binding transcriptional regulator LsrR (DeoR family)
MSVSFELKPGERLNEGELAKRLGVSRTPLREALNRLNTEGFLRFTPARASSAASYVLKRHIDRRLDTITSAIKEGRLRSHLHALGEVG